MPCGEFGAWSEGQERSWEWGGRAVSEKARERNRGLNLRDSGFMLKTKGTSGGCRPESDLVGEQHSERPGEEEG